MLGFAPLAGTPLAALDEEAGVSVVVSLTGTQAAGATGTLGILADANLSLTGVFATGAVGTIAASYITKVTLADVYASGFVGTLDPAASASMRLGGLPLIPSLGKVSVWGVLDNSPQVWTEESAATGIWTDAQSATEIWTEVA